jgi:hypothetical protein
VKTAGQGLGEWQAQKTLHHNMPGQTQGKESFAIRVIETWNRLPDTVVSN